MFFDPKNMHLNIKRFVYTFMYGTAKMLPLTLDAFPILPYNKMRYEA